MALKLTFKDTEFGVGDMVRVSQTLKESTKSGKSRLQNFDGTVIAIKGSGISKTFTVRRIGVQQIGIEKIFPVNSPSLSEIKIIKKGLKGVRRAKLYYLRTKAKKEAEKIYKRTQLKASHKNSK